MKQEYLITIWLVAASGVLQLQIVPNSSNITGIFSTLSSPSKYSSTLPNIQ